MKVVNSVLSPAQVLLGASVVNTMVHEGFSQSLANGLYQGTPIAPFCDRLRVVCMALEEAAKLSKTLAEEMLEEQMRGYHITITPLTTDGGSPAHRD